MKKVVALLLVLVLLVGASACQRREHASESEVQASVDDSEPESKPESSSEPEQPLEPESQEEPGPGDIEGAKSATEEALSALQSGDKSAIQACLDYTNLLLLENGNQSDANALAVLTRLQYEIGNVEAKQETATVSVKLTNIDMTTVLPAYLKSAMDMEYNNAISENPLPDEEMESKYQVLFNEALNENAGSTVSKTVEIRLIKNGDKWRVQVNEALRDGVTGNYFSAKKQVGNNAGGGQR